MLDCLAELRVLPEEIDWLAATKRFRRDFLSSLMDLRSTGDVWAMPEGTVFFPDEPILRITAPLREAQVVESRIINVLHYQSLVASKAARCVAAAGDKLLVDFGLRRAHGAEAGLLSARASYLAGFSGTATVLAGMRFGIPIYGTMAHSYVQAHEDEAQAFENFARSQPGNCVLLIDTYFASGNLDEYKLRELLSSGAPIDGFGVGTRMNTSADAPYLDCAYKLTEYAGRARRKRSEGKATWPGRKQVYRRFDANGELACDVLTLQGDAAPGTALLEPVLIAGERRLAAPGLEASRELAHRQLAALPKRLRLFDPAEPYQVEISEPLGALARLVDANP